VTGRLRLPWPNPQCLAFDPFTGLVVVTHGYEVPGKGCPLSLVDAADLELRP